MKNLPLPIDFTYTLPDNNSSGLYVTFKVKATMIDDSVVICNIKDVNISDLTYIENMHAFKRDVEKVALNIFRSKNIQ